MEVPQFLLPRKQTIWWSPVFVWPIDLGNSPLPSQLTSEKSHQAEKPGGIPKYIWLTWPFGWCHMTSEPNVLYLINSCMYVCLSACMSNAYIPIYLYTQICVVCLPGPWCLCKLIDIFCFITDPHEKQPHDLISIVALGYPPMCRFSHPRCESHLHLHYYQTTIVLGGHRLI